MKVFLWLAVVLVAVRAESTDMQGDSSERTTRIKVVNLSYETETFFTASFLQERRRQEDGELIKEYQDYVAKLAERSSQQELNFTIPFPRIKAFGLALQHLEGSVDDRSVDNDSTCIAIIMCTIPIPVKEILVTINEGYFAIAYQAKLPPCWQFSSEE